MTRHLSIAIAAVLLALLAVLAALQWRWIGEVSALERQRMRSGLVDDGSRFTRDFDREVTQAFLYFHPELSDPAADWRARLLRQYERWQAEATNPKLVRDVFLVVGHGAAAEPELSVLRPRQGRLEPCPWPAELAGVRRRLTERAHTTRLGPRIVGVRMGVVPDLPGLLIPVNWSLHEDSRGDPPRAEAHVVLRLDRRVIAGEILPALTRRYFDRAEQSDYVLAVVDAVDGGKVLYRSDPTVPAEDFRGGDVRLGFFGLRPFDELHSLMGAGGPGQLAHNRRRPSPWAWLHHRSAAPETASRARESGAWALVIKHRDGTLEDAVIAIRHRNLGISLGILALLGATVVMMLVSTQRAQRLARQQIEFVAGVTHELNTPLTAIRSAGQNLADGVVAEPTQVKRYGTLIENEGRRLSNMVGQALELAGIQSGRRVYHPRPVDVADVVAGALDDCAWLLQERQIRVEREVEPDLPLVLADAAALRRAVQNLLENAVKYGGRAGWIGVRARRGPSSQVEVTVSDRGPGIRREDLPHLFEPFFRGGDAAAGTIPGSGLGLSLVRHIVEAHGGRVTVATEATANSAGIGSAFTLHLPAAAVDASEIEAVGEPA